MTFVCNKESTRKLLNDKKCSIVLQKHGRSHRRLDDLDGVPEIVRVSESVLCTVARTVHSFGIACVAASRVAVVFGAEQPHERWTSKRVCYSNGIVRSADGAVVKSQMLVNRSRERAEMGDVRVFGAVRHGVIKEALEKRIHRRLVYNRTVKLVLAFYPLDLACVLRGSDY